MCLLPPPPPHTHTQVVSGTAMKKLDWDSNQRLLLAGNPLVFPPLDVCECGIRSIVQFYVESKSTVKVYQGIKVLMLGCSGAGKTSLVQSLVDQQSRLTEDAEGSAGIDIHEVVIEGDDQLTKPLQLSIWDLAGADEFSYPNCIFLQQPCLVLMTFNMADYAETNFNYMIGRWMDQLLARNNKLVVLPVGTHADLLSEARRKSVCWSVRSKMCEHLEQHLAAVQAEMRKIESRPHISTALSEQLKSYLTLLSADMVTHDEVVAVSAKTLEGVPSLFAAIKSMATDKATFPNVMRPIPSLWLDIESYVEERGYQMDVPVMRWSDLADEIKLKFGTKHVLQMVVGYLADTGKVLWFSEHPTLKKYIFIRPSWITDLLKPLFVPDLATSCGAGFHLDDNFKSAGVPLARYEQMVSEFVDEGVAERDLLRCVWAHLLPSDRNKPLIDTLALLIDHFEFGYFAGEPPGPNRSPAPSRKRYNSAGSSRSSTASTASVSAAEFPFFISPSTVHFDQVLTSRVLVPWRCRTAQPRDCRQIHEQRCAATGSARIAAVYRFPRFLPPGIFERLTVRAHRPGFGLRPLYHWKSGICAVHPSTPDNGENAENSGVLFFLKRIRHHDDGSICVRIEVCHETKVVGEKDIDPLWVVLLPFLHDTDDLLATFQGIVSIRNKTWMAYPALFLRCSHLRLFMLLKH